MYTAKRARFAIPAAIGLNDPSSIAAQHVDLEEALAGAAARGELCLEYQPIVSARDGLITGSEALLRWMHPDRGLIPPSVLIPLAERCDLIGEIAYELAAARG